MITPRVAPTWSLNESHVLWTGFGATETHLTAPSASGAGKFCRGAGSITLSLGLEGECSEAGGGLGAAPPSPVNTTEAAGEGSNVKHMKQM